MDSLSQKCFGINVKVLQRLWMYPHRKPDTYNKVLTYIKYFLIATPVPVMGFLSVILDENDVRRVVENAYVVAVTGKDFCKLLPVVMYRGKIKKCICFFNKNQITVISSREKMILDETVRICRRNTNIYLGIFLDGYLVWALKAMVAGYSLPIDVWLPFDIKQVPFLFHGIIYTWVLAGVLYPVLVASVIDPLVGGLAYLATGQLKLLKEKLALLGKDIDFTVNPEKNSKIVCDQIRDCIYYHNKILDFVKLFEKSFSLMAFSQIMGSSLMICICCFELSIAESVTINEVLVFYYIMCMLAQVYFYCYYGTLLYEESKSLPDSIWMSQWFRCDTRSKKLLITFMEKTKKPMVITAGKFTNLSLNTFTMILKRSYSLLALLKNYQ